MSKAVRTPKNSWRMLIAGHINMIQDYAKNWLKRLLIPLVQRRRLVFRSHVRHRLITHNAGSPHCFSSQYLLSSSNVTLDHLHRPTPIHTSHDLIAPKLQSVHHGALANLLRRGGLQPTEDEVKEREKVSNDLRGITIRSPVLKVVNT